MLSKTESQFLKDLVANKLGAYSYEYQRMLRKRILDKRKALTEDIYLISKAEDKLRNLPSRKKKSQKVVEATKGFRNDTGPEGRGD